MLQFGKPTREQALLERRELRAKRRTHERNEKADIVARDGSRYCRLVPHCPEREKFETAHLEDKGMGGDPAGLRTQSALMVRSCFFHHQGNWSLHSKDLRVEFLTEEKADGPIQVWGRDDRGEWYLVGLERQVGIWERD